MTQSKTAEVVPPRRAAAEIETSFHVAVVMDGNGRWATARGLRRVEGHRRGACAVRRTVRAAPSLGITTLTLFAFSCDNWKRPRSEVEALMSLFGEYLHSETRELLENGVRLSVIGRRDRLTDALVAAIEACEGATAEASRFHLRLAIDYSAREAIARAARLLAAESEPCIDAFRKRLGTACGDGRAPDVDLLIRTGGEHRLSDFLLWESAYAELVFLPRMWPDFRASDLAAAVAEFRTRQRRFGALPLDLAASGNHS
jgi:undecaprenyl diphosphate synthase